MRKLDILVTEPNVFNALTRSEIFDDPDLSFTFMPYLLDEKQRAGREQGDPTFTNIKEVLEPDLLDALSTAEVLIGLDAPLDLEFVAPRLRWIQAVGSGTGHLRASVSRGSTIVVSNAAGVAAASVSEWVIGQMLFLLKDFGRYIEMQGERMWQVHHGALVEGRTMAIIGLGSIGRAVAQRARPFGLELLGVRRSHRSGQTDDAVDQLFSADQLNEVLPRADIVVLTAPGTAETEDMIASHELSLMPRGSILLNVGRGTLVDETALIENLRSGHLRGAAVDVLRSEPLPPTSELWTTPNLVITPHSSSSPEGYLEKFTALLADNVSRFRSGNILRNIVNLS